MFVPVETCESLVFHFQELSAGKRSPGADEEDLNGYSNSSVRCNGEKS